MASSIHQSQYFKPKELARKNWAGVIFGHGLPVSFWFRHFFLAAAKSFLAML